MAHKIEAEKAKQTLTETAGEIRLDWCEALSSVSEVRGALWAKRGVHRKSGTFDTLFEF